MTSTVNWALKANDVSLYPLSLSLSSAFDGTGEVDVIDQLAAKVAEVEAICTSFLHLHTL